MAKNCQTFPSKDYFMDESECDVIFVVEEQKIPSIRALLALKSYVFKKMFSGPFKESKDKEVSIKDTNSEAFRQMIEFLHCEKLNLTSKVDYSMAIEVLKCGHKYQIITLLSYLEDFLSPMISVKKFEELYNLSNVYDLPKLKRSLNQFIDTNLDRFMSKDMNEIKRINTLSDSYLLNSVVNSRSALKDEIKNLHYFIEYGNGRVTINGNNYNRSDFNRDQTTDQMEAILYKN